MEKLAFGFGQNCVDPSLYAGWDGWLAGCVNDTADLLAVAAQRGCAVQAKMSQQAGILPPYETVTGASLLAFREAFQVAKSLNTGDLIVIQDSGHGGQTDAGEFLCFYDGVLWDTEIHAMLAEVPEGVGVVLILDACHSGGMDRGFSLTPVRAMRSHVVDALVASNCLRAAPPQPPADVSAQVLMFCACQPDQTALDGQRNGVFTGCLLATVAKYRAAGTVPTYADWFMETQKFMAAHYPEQTPVLKVLGNGAELLNSKIF